MLSVHDFRPTKVSCSQTAERSTLIKVDGDSDSTEVLAGSVNVVIAGVRLFLVKLHPLSP
jgi:hypothetical protein